MPDKMELPVQNGSGYYTAQVVVAVNNGLSTAQIGYRLTDTFFYNDANAIYHYLVGYHQISPVPYPDPPMINCRPSAGNNGCPKYSGRQLRINLIQYYNAHEQRGLIPPGVTADTSGSNYQPHHIKPGSCGGDREPSNGMFIANGDQSKFTTWFRKFIAMRSGHDWQVRVELTYDWLPGRIAHMERIARELEVKLTWDVNEAASEDELRACEAAFARVNVPFGPSHPAFLRRYNGATVPRGP
jgi:hypothetical protein